MYTLSAPFVFENDTLDLLVKFTDKEGIPLDIKRALINYVNPVTQITYAANSTYSFKINPEKLRFIACEDFKGRIFVINREQLMAAKIKNHSLVFLPMNLLERPVKKEKDLHMPLGLYLK